MSPTRRRLLRWLVVPLAAAAAVTTVQVVQDAPGPLRADSAGAAPQLSVPALIEDGRTYRVTSYEGPQDAPVSGTVEVCGDVAADDRGCLDVTFAVTYEPFELRLLPAEEGSVEGRRLSLGSDILFRPRAARLAPLPPNGAEEITERVALRRTTIGFQHGRTFVDRQPREFYRIFMPRNVNRANDVAVERTVYEGDPQWQQALGIVNDLREAARLQNLTRRNLGFGIGTNAVSALSAYVAIAASNPLAGVGVLTAWAVTSMFFYNGAADSHASYMIALRRAGAQFRLLPGPDIEQGRGLGDNG